MEFVIFFIKLNFDGFLLPNKQLTQTFDGYKKMTFD